MTTQPTASPTPLPMQLVDGYQPGVCNIGPSEIRRRTMAGHVGLVGAVGLLAVLAVLGAPPVTRLLVIAPAAVSASGYIQARSKFCANYAWRGIVNLGDEGDAVGVEDAAARSADQRRARQIGLQSLAIGVAAGLASLVMTI